MKTKPVFDVRESHLCAELKCSLAELRARRGTFLVQGVHWDYVKKRVLLSAVGALILRGTHGACIVPENQKNAPRADCETPARPLAGLLMEKNAPRVPFLGELTVWDTPGFNPRIVTAYIPGTDPANPLNLVKVMVRDNGKFLRGMTLPGPAGKLLQLTDATYDLQGQCPRWRGKW